MTIHNLFADKLQILRDATLGKIDLEKEHPFLSRQLQLFYNKHSNNDLTLVENLTVDFYHAQPV